MSRLALGAALLATLGLPVGAAQASTVTLRSMTHAAGSVTHAAVASRKRDTTPPAIAITAPASGAVTDGRPSFSGTAESLPRDSAVLRIYAGGDLAATPVASLRLTVATDGGWAVRPPLLDPGSYTARASERDAAGNVGFSTAVPLTVAPTIAAAGDIACPPGSIADIALCQQQATSDLIFGGGYHRVLALGDNQYNSGTLTEFTGGGAFDDTWGRFKSLISPVAGNHEYNDPAGGAKGYFDYFDGPTSNDGPAGPRGKGWYDFTLGNWHLIALNSDCAQVGGCGSGSAQEVWLRGVLAASSAACTLVYWHHPRFSSGNGGYATNMQQIWQDVVAAHADLVLNGHSHGFEQFDPMDATGAADAAGVQEMVVGTGGEDFYPMSNPMPTSRVRIANTFGILRLTLRPSAYDWKFVSIAGLTLTSGTRACH